MPLILIVDDEPTVAAMIEHALQLEGFSVLTAPSSEEAVMVSQSHRGEIGLLITEVELPGIAGPMLAARLLAEGPEMPVLFISGCCDAMDFGRLQQFEFLAKPFALQDLVSRVQRLMRLKTITAVN